MERHNMFMDWKTQHSKVVNFPLPQTSQKRLNAILIRIPARLFVDIVKMILNFHENAEELE